MYENVYRILYIIIKKMNQMNIKRWLKNGIPRHYEAFKKDQRDP